MKKLFQILVGLIAVFAVGALILSFSLDGMVESTIEDTSSDMLQTTVDVKEVNLSILDGQGTITGITVHNPEGFSDNPALQLQQISMKVKLKSLLSDTIVVERVEIENPELFFEQKASGSNFDALSSNLNSGSTSSSQTYLVVEYLEVQDGRVTLSTDIGGEKSMEATIGRFTLEDIGRADSSTMEQTLRQILQPILQKATRQALQQGLLDKAKEKLENLLDG
jgi:hypothetical protein